MSTIEASQWFSIPQPNPHASARLFCFPYAGGDAQVYRAWPRHLQPSFEVCAVRLPGRGLRIKEPPFRDLAPMVAAIAAAVAPYLDRPFAFFGHSMGALVGFELARLLRERGGPAPAHLFVSGCRAPQLPGNLPVTYDLPDVEFIEYLRSLNGTPAEVFDHPELLELLLPLLRADFTVVETYRYRPGPALDCPVTAFGGARDLKVSQAKTEAWGVQTSGAFDARIMPGGHFFLNDSQTRALILKVIAAELERVPHRYVDLKPAKGGSQAHTTSNEG
jgi:medium-chain acyl-[acyl-carrier-protein] hydrolase